MSTTWEEFGGFWDDLNLEYPPYKFEPEEMERQARVYFAELESFPIGVLRESLRRWMRESEKRPRLAALIFGARVYQEELRKATETRRVLVAESNPDRCPCGCAGERWALVLRDREGKPRKFNAALTETTATAAAGAFGAIVAEKIRALADDFMTRDHVECRLRNFDAPPREHGRLLGKDERGLGVWIDGPN